MNASLEGACLISGSMALPPKALAPLLHEAAHRAGPTGRVYVAIRDAGDHSSPPLLEWLGQLYGIVGDIEPRLDVVPLLPFAGWSKGAVERLVGVDVLGDSDEPAAGASGSPTGAHALPDALAAPEDVSASALLRAMLPGRTPAAVIAAAVMDEQAELEAGAPVSTATLPETHEGDAQMAALEAALRRGAGASTAAAATAAAAASASASAVRALPEVPAVPPAPAVAAATAEAAPAAAAAAAAPLGQGLAFNHVAVGGTFDRLHAGHRLLLAATALVATQRVYVGVTADELLAKKSHREWLQSLDARSAAATAFMAVVRPSLDIQAGSLRDPAAPTQAELDPDMQALVVSRETLPGGEAINRGRRECGFQELQLVVVRLVGERADGSKLSSTALREQDAAAGRPR